MFIEMNGENRGLCKAIARQFAFLMRSPLRNTRQNTFLTRFPYRLTPQTAFEKGFALFKWESATAWRSNPWEHMGLACWSRRGGTKLPALVACQDAMALNPAVKIYDAEYTGVCTVQF